MISTFSLILASTTLIAVLFVAFSFLRGMSQVKRLKDLDLQSHERDESLDPMVSIVVAARNEEKHIGPAVQSLLEMDYSSWELLVVDDRSTDRTSEILSELQRSNPILRVQRIEQLPDGWLGKNHALDFGIREAKGEFVLLTDADIFFEPSTLGLAIRYMTRERLDHLAMTPKVDMPGVLLRSFTVMFFIFFFIFTKAWKVRDPKSRAYVGIGAFGLFRRQMLLDLDGLKSIRLRPDDDLMLGRIVKRGGYQQGILDGDGMISVPWYANVGEVIRGLEKNSFAAFNYRPEIVIGSIVAQVVLLILPFLAIWITSGVAWWFNLVSVMILLGMPTYLGWKYRYGWYVGLCFPVCTLLFCYIQLRAMILCYWRGGVRWRDTHYSLESLRQNKVV